MCLLQVIKGFLLVERITYPERKRAKKVFAENAKTTNLEVTSLLMAMKKNKKEKKMTKILKLKRKLI